MKVKKLRIDNGLKFYNQKFGSYCVNERIAKHRTVRFNTSTKQDGKKNKHDTCRESKVYAHSI